MVGLSYGLGVLRKNWLDIHEISVSNHKVTCPLWIVAVCQQRLI